MNDRNTEQQLRYLGEVCTCLYRAGFETTQITATGVSSWMRRSSRQSWRRSMTAVPAYTRSLIWNG